ncbi:MAG: type VI secretion system tip protein VgrG [Deltaproteobacteria bacterium]|nr:type VI secretion system tip protein VgrG [Deltaproteobacteria bacterium]
MNDRIPGPNPDLRGVYEQLQDARLDTVAYAVEIHDGPDPGWRVRRFDLSEGLSRTYQMSLELMTETLDTNPDGLLGASLTLDIERGDRLRTIHGVIDRVEYVGLSRDRLQIRVHVVPALQLLDLGTDSRIFQGLTVPEILEQVLGPALEEYGRTVDTSGLSGEYEPRDYCVQYRESDLAFASRLMEDEGIGYAFVADADAREEIMRLVDDNHGYEPVDGLDGQDVPIITDQPELFERESISFFDWRLCQRPSAVVSRGFNFKAPAGPAEGDAKLEAGKGPAVYDHDERRHVVDDLDDDGFDGQTQQRRTMAARRLEAIAAETQRGEGQSIVSGFCPGRTFVLGEHNRADLEQTQFLLTQVTHAGECPDEDIDAAAEGARYCNTFECMPVGTPFRPASTTARPRVYGPQTAVVTGPAGEEIHTDKFGRIKVKFYWDRLGPDDDGSSCWVRVAQTWAHGGWGSVFLPRVGMEVVIEFLDGNPDRPLCIGCVYNGAHDTPYPLPEDKTKSTIKSSSSPGGDGFNELRFEDAAGSEEIYIHGQKDLTVEILHDTNTRIDHHETHTVGGDRKVVVHGNQVVEVDGQPPDGGDGFKGSSTSVNGDYKVNASKTAFIEAPDSITLSCPGSYIKLEPGKITLWAGGGASLVLDGNAFMKSAGESTILLDGNACMSSSGKSSILLDSNACTSSSDGSSVLLDSNAKVSSSNGASALYDASATIVGAKATVASKSGGAVVLTANADLMGAVTTCAGGGGSCVLDGGGAKLSGGKVDIGGGVVNIG